MSHDPQKAPPNKRTHYRRIQRRKRLVFDMQDLALFVSVPCFPETKRVMETWASTP